MVADALRPAAALGKVVRRGLIRWTRCRTAAIRRRRAASEPLWWRARRRGGCVCTTSRGSRSRRLSPEKSWPILAAEVILGVVGHLLERADEASGLAGEVGRSLSGPNTSMATTPMTNISGQPMPNMVGDPYSRPAGARPSCMPASPRERPLSLSATPCSSLAATESGSDSMIGMPLSPPMRKFSSSGICARTGTS